MSAAREPQSAGPVSALDSDNTPSATPETETPPTPPAQQRSNYRSLRRIAAEPSAEAAQMLRVSANLQKAVEAVMDRNEQQARLLETVTTRMTESLEEWRETLDVLQQVIAGQDDQLDKLADVTEALITATQALQALAS